MSVRGKQMSAEVIKMSSQDKDKNVALEAAIGQIEKAFGKGSVMKLGTSGANMDVQAISSGSLGLDVALGIGGLPKGRIVEIYGPESSGKTTLALHVVAESQKTGGTCAFVDAEHALDPVYAKKLGVNIDELLISQPDAGEQALEIADTLVRSGAVSVLVVDSVAALVPRAELEGDMGDTHMGLQARLMSQALRKLTSSISKSNCLVIFINQIRQKIGIMFGNPETTSGGNALKFYASVRLDIRRIGAIKDKDEIVGNQTRVKVVKNKVAPPFRTVEFDIMYGEGISKNGEIIDLGVAAGIVEKSGSWFSYKGLQARLMSQALRKLTSSISKSNCLVIFINQIRQKIGIMFGNPETTSGGNALKFYASVRLDIRRIGAIKDKDEIVGNQTRVKVVKNKVAPPFRTVEFDIMYGEGISKNGEIIDLGVAAGIVEKSGSWFSYNEQRIGQGRENAKNFLKENIDIALELEEKIKGNSVLVEEILMNPEQTNAEEEK